MQSRLIRTTLLSLALTTLFIALPEDPASARHPHTDIHQRKTDLPPDYYLRFDGIIELY